MNIRILASTICRLQLAWLSHIHLVMHILVLMATAMSLVQCYLIALLAHELRLLSAIILPLEAPLPTISLWVLRISIALVLCRHLVLMRLSLLLKGIII